MKRPRWLGQLLARLDYGLLLPALARLPPWAAAGPVVLRGSINCLFDLDWRTLALGHGYVRRATFKTMRSLGARTGWQAGLWTLRRFVTASREEVDSWRLRRLDGAALACEEHGVDALLALAAQGRGAVLLTAHVDSLYVGLCRLARRGLRIHLMSTRIVEDPRVPPAITRHHLEKIDALRLQLAPGRVAHFEDGLKPFVSALRRGEIVVIAGDAPATENSRGSDVQFLGARHAMAAGPEFLARTAGVPVGTYLCRREGLARWRVDIAAPVALEAGGLQHAYDALGAQLQAAPWRWWAADLFQVYRAAHEAGGDAGRADSGAAAAHTAVPLAAGPCSGGAPGP